MWTESMPDNANRRAFLKSTGAVGAAAFAGCIGGEDAGDIDIHDIDEIPPPETEDDVINWNFYNFWHEPLTDDFRDEHGIQVHHNFYASDEELRSELVAGNPEGIDAAGPSSTLAVMGIDEGWWEPLPTDLLDNAWGETIDRAQEASEEFYSRDGEIYAIKIMENTVPCLHWNTDFFDGPPPSYGILWEEDLEDQVAMMDSWSMNTQTGAMYTGQNPNDPDDLDEIEEALHQQRDLNRTYWGDWSHGMEMMATEEIVSTVSTAGRAWMANFLEDSPVDWTVPEEGAVIGGAAFSIPTGQAHPRAALTWMEFAADPINRIKLFTEGGVSPATRTFDDDAQEVGISEEEVEFMDLEEKNIHDATLYDAEGMTPETRDDLIEVWERVRT